MFICVPVKVKEYDIGLKIIRKIGKKADFIELWCDRLDQEAIAALIKISKIPVIAVCKGRVKKGDFKGDEGRRVGRLVQAANSGAASIDWPMHTDKKLLSYLKKTCKKTHTRFILSYHFWHETPALNVLIRHVALAKKAGADIIKIAAWVKNWSDNVILFELTRRCVARGFKVIVVGMGPRGMISRFGCGLLGSYLTYVAFDEKSRTAQGQPILSGITSQPLTFNLSCLPAGRDFSL